MTSWDSFGYEWTRWSRTQLDGPGRTESEETFIQKTGLLPADVRGKTVLDVGCGAGRFLEVVSRWGARFATGIEPSSAARVAQTNLLNRQHTQVYRVDLQSFSALAVVPFDLVYCLGVLHHTPDPAESFRTIARLVTPGGTLCVWVYWEHEGGPWIKVLYWYRHLTIHLPWTLLYLMSTLAVPWAFVRNIPWIGKYLWALFPSSTHPNWRWRMLDTFDVYSPRYRSQHSIEEVRGWFSQAGFEDITTLDFPVSIRGRKSGGSSDGK